MKADLKELRTSNKKGLIGFKAKYHGEKVIAIMKGKEAMQCIGFIRPEELLHDLDNGPFLDLDNLIG